MSLDQLPNELIARIGSFLSFKDNIQFGLSQKRIHAVLKRDGLLKPECKTIEFNVTHPGGHFTLPDCTQFLIEEEKRDPRFNSAVGQIINKFRKIEVIDFSGVRQKVTEGVFKDLLKTKTKLSSLYIYDVEVAAVDPNIFMSACKKFDKIELKQTLLPPEVLCDQVLLEIMPHTKFSLINFEDGPLDGYLLTDRTLKALTDLEVKDYFEIRAILTSFTIAGIKTLVEELLKAETFVAEYDLGILKFSEGRTAVRWLEEVAADPDCPYIIRRYDLYQGAFPYMIKLNIDIRRKMVIEFAINQVEV